MSRRALYALLIALGLIILSVLFIVFREPAESAPPELGCAMTNASGGVMGLPDPACPNIETNLECETVASATDTITLGKFKGEELSYDTSCTHPGGPNIFHYFLGVAPPGPTGIVDSSVNSGSASKSIDAVGTDSIYISYYASAGDLKFARSTDGGDNWALSVLDSGLGQGTDTSLDAVAGVATPDTVFISYFDNTNDDLKFARSTDGGTNWATSTVASTGNVGYFNSLAAVNANTVYIGYWEFTPSNTRLRFAKSTNGGSTWTISTVASTGIVGQATSLSAFDGNTATTADDTIYISYRDDTNNDLRVAKSTNGGSTWATSLVDSTDSVGFSTSIDAVDANTVFLSYRDSANQGSGATGGALKLARTANGGSSWTLSTVDDVDNVGDFSSIEAVDALTVYIAYWNQSNNNLKLAGTTDGGATTWATSVIHASVNRYSSIHAVDASTLYTTFSSYTPFGLMFVVE